jgi:hypothetical protein
MAKVDGQFLIVLDVQRVLDLDELAAVAELAADAEALADDEADAAAVVELDGEEGTADEASGDHDELASPVGER